MMVTLAGAMRSAGVTDPDAAVDHMVSVMLDANLTPAAHQAIKDHVAVAGFVGSSMSGKALSDALFLVASTPEYQLA